ncbi:MAG TPA: AAA family ATPase [Solirubrobacterales bacterium]
MARLTILAGSNSSGKSSLLQSALFLAQSVKAKACVINGDLVSLGEPKDVLRDGADEMAIEVSFGQPVPGEDEPKHVQFYIALREDEGEDDLIPHEMKLSVNRRLEISASSATCPKGLAPLLAEREVPLALTDPGEFNLPEESFLTAVGMEPGRLVYRANERDLRSTFERLARSTVAGYVLYDLVLGEMKAGSAIPSALFEKIREYRLAGNTTKRRAKLSDEELDLLFPFYMERFAPEGWASEEITLPPLGGQTSPYSQAILAMEREEGGPIAPVLTLMGQAGKRMDSFAGSVVYLGPLRDDPRVAYPLGHTISNLPVGKKGEFTAAYLESNRGRNIIFQNPDKKTVHDTLLAAASKWSRYLGIADEVGVESRGKFGHLLSITIDGHDRDPTAIGVGASQLLPVVVTVLGAARGQLVLLEQPELHLHPRVQSRLADFLAWARPDVRLLIETHSEYLIARLRLRIAEGGVNPKNVAALFVSMRRPDEGTVAPSAAREPFSEFKELEVDELGDFSHWPDGFFDSLDQDMVMLARAVTEKLDQRDDETASDS